jgi:hypothetical protein
LRSASALRGHALLLGRLLHLEAVLVRPGEEEHVLAVEALEARHRVARDRRIGVADMRLAVRVEDRRGDVELVGRHLLLNRAGNAVR